MTENQMLKAALRVLSHDHPTLSSEAMLARAVLVYFHPEFFVKNLNARALDPNAEPENEPLKEIP
jgi:hypothetical protein